MKLLTIDTLIYLGRHVLRHVIYSKMLQQVRGSEDWTEGWEDG